MGKSRDCLGVCARRIHTATANVKSLGEILCVELIPTSQIFSRQRVLFVFALPEYCDDPPALSVVHQLNAVDAPREGLFFVLGVARFIGAEEVGNAPEFLSAAGYLALEKTALFHERRVPLDVVLWRQRARHKFTCRPATSRNQTRARRKQRTESIPIPWSRRARNHVVQSGYD